VCVNACNCERVCISGCEGVRVNVLVCVGVYVLLCVHACVCAFLLYLLVAERALR